ncbi:MAG: hypothetical protein E7214_05885 [Clostridium sp.]|nr:hypothetical protein [Clostridium sp.]
MDNKKDTILIESFDNWIQEQKANFKECKKNNSSEFEASTKTGRVYEDDKDILLDPNLDTKVESVDPKLIMNFTHLGSLSSTAMNRARLLSSRLKGKTNSSALTPTETKSILEIFKENPTSGFTSIIDFIFKGYNIDPTKGLSGYKINTLLNAINKLSSCPLITLSHSDTIHYDRKSKDWNTSINDIVNYYVGVSTEDKARIRSSLISITSAAISHKKTEQSDNLFLQGSLIVEKDYIYLWIFNSNVRVVANKKKGGTVVQTVFDITRNQFKFSVENWNKNYAEIMMKEHIKSMDDWLNDNCTPEGSNTVALTCFV